MKPMIGRCLGALMLVAVPASAADATNPITPREGRGFVLGMGFGAARVDFGGAEDLALVIGGPTGTLTFPSGGGTIEVRRGQIVSRSLVPADAEGIVPIPSNENGLGISFQAGWSFSPRVAALLDFDIAGKLQDSFDNFVVGFVARYSPTSRLWIEAGPAFGELRYGSSGSVVHDFAGRGSGVLVGVGVAIVKRPVWYLDVQARVGTLWYEQLRATNVSAQLGISRRRS
jgi:hypothetical protein